MTEEAENLDPTAAPDYHDVEQVEMVASFDGETVAEEQDEWVPADGFVDGTGTVRIWVGPQGEPERIWLSRYWRNQMAKVPLSVLFAEPMLQISLHCGEPLVPPPMEIDLPDSNELSGPELDAVLDAEYEELSKALDAVISAGGGQGHWIHEPAEGTAEQGRVQVCLDMRGCPQAVSFDDQWLANASASQVIRAVTQAWGDARSRYVAPVYEPGPYDLVLAKFEALMVRRERAFARGLDLLGPITDEVRDRARQMEAGQEDHE